MARPIRIERAGGWYHITARGNERRAIYRDDHDRRHFCGLLAQTVSQFQVRLHAYVLMNNHYHLLLELQEANLSRAVQWLNVSYSVWFNRRHGRSGHLFQGRFKSVLLNPQEWALGLSRYLHLNPVRTGRLGLDKAQQRRVRAGVSGRPEAALVRQRIEWLRGYRWSSYRAYIGLGARPAWLQCGEVLGLGGGGAQEQPRRYREYVEAAVREGLDQSPWAELKEQIVLGSQEFVAGLRPYLTGDEREQRAAKRVTQARPKVAEIVRALEEVRGRKWEEFRDRHGDVGRDLVLYLARRLCGAKLDALAALAGVKEYATVAMAVKRFEARLTQQPSVQAECRRVRELSNVDSAEKRGVFQQAFLSRPSGWRVTVATTPIHDNR